MGGSIVVRVAAVGALGPAADFAGLVTAHALGRGAAVAVMALAPVARPDGLGADYARRVTKGAGGGRRRDRRRRRRRSRRVVGGPALVAVVAVAAAPVVTLAVRALRGITGDVLGAVEQIAETLVLVACTALAHRYDRWWS